MDEHKENEEQVRVLLVEDDPIAGKLLRNMLLGSVAPSFAISWVQDLKQGIQLLGRNPFDVLLLDLNLPDSQGFESLFRFLEFKSIAIVIVSGNNDEELRIAALLKGAQYFLVKGTFQNKTLILAVQYAIQQKHAELEWRKADQQRMEFEAEIEKHKDRIIQIQIEQREVIRSIKLVRDEAIQNFEEAKIKEQEAIALKNALAKKTAEALAEANEARLALQQAREESNTKSNEIDKQRREVEDVSREAESAKKLKETMSEKFNDIMTELNSAKHQIDAEKQEKLNILRKYDELESEHQTLVTRMDQLSKELDEAKSMLNSRDGLNKP